MLTMRVVYLKVGESLKKCIVEGLYADQFDGLNAALGSARFCGQPEEDIRQALNDLAVQCVASGEYRVAE